MWIPYYLSFFESILWIQNVRVSNLTHDTKVFNIDLDSTKEKYLSLTKDQKHWKYFESIKIMYIIVV